MEDLKINVVIGGRNYPIRIKDASEEEGIRKAAAKINDLLMQYESNYAVNDKQDVLAMCALQFASQMEIKNLEVEKDQLLMNEKLDELNKLLNEKIN
ncbi:MAG: cell division protein ZapA [Flavobacteriaceae bacterium]